MYTDQLTNTHSVWNKIQNNDIILDQAKNTESRKPNIDEELAKNIYNNINKYSSTSTSTACRLCGYVGHLAYQCRNNVVLKNSMMNQSSMQINIKETGIQLHALSIRIIKILKSIYVIAII